MPRPGAAWPRPLWPLYDVALDIAGNHTWPEIKRALTPKGTYVLIGHDQYGASGHRWFGSLGRFAKLMVMDPFVDQLRPFAP